MEAIKASSFIEPVFQTKSEKESEWFGYYNYDPLNHDQTRLLCNRSKYEGVAPEKGMVIELGFYNTKSGEWNHIGNSDSWNWQQGAMMQWLPGEGNENKVIYNTSANNRLVSVIHDVETGKDAQINWPIYGITPDGKKSISLEMERSYWCNAYHYQSVARDEYNVPVLESDGIFEIDLEHNTRKRIVSIQSVLELDPDPDFGELKHWLEHIMISPDGTHFVFLHRFCPRDNMYQYQTRAIIAKIDGTDLQILPEWRDYSWSHFGWNGSKGFSLYSIVINKLQRAFIQATKDMKEEKKSFNLKDTLRGLLVKAKGLLPVKVRVMLKGGNSSTMYLYYGNENGKYILQKKWQQELLNIDGHPSFTSDGKYMITDSYPDSNGYQRLMVLNTENEKILLLGSFFASMKGTPASCDLHPKLCRNNNYLTIDSAFDKKHHMLTYQLQWEEIKKIIG